LLDKATAEIGVDQPTVCHFDREHEVFVANGFAFRKPGESFGFEYAHKRLYRSIDYRYMNYNSRRKPQKNESRASYAPP
jgi:hypothetical protein